MELDDLKARWMDFDRKLDASLRLNARLVRESLIERTERTLRRSSFVVLAAVVINVLLVWWLGSFMADHAGEMRFFIPAAILNVGAIAVLVLGAQQFVRMRTLDHGRSVLEVQREIQALQVQQIHLTRWIVFLSPLIWTPMVIVFFAALGVDTYRVMPAWLLANLLFGVAAIPVLFYGAQALSARLQGTSFLQGLVRDTAGRGLFEAGEFMKELAAFENENGKG
ncbi:MAG: hypothetical protein ABI672_20455 [Vicinamibacteria bacterium]